MNSRYFILVFSYIINQCSSGCRMNNVTAAYPVATWQLHLIFLTVRKISEAAWIWSVELPCLWTKAEVCLLNFLVDRIFYNIFFLAVFHLLNPVFSELSIAFNSAATILKYRCLEHSNSCLWIFKKIKSEYINGIHGFCLPSGLP